MKYICESAQESIAFVQCPVTPNPIDKNNASGPLGRSWATLATSWPLCTPRSRPRPRSGPLLVRFYVQIHLQDQAQGSIRTTFRSILRPDQPQGSSPSRDQDHF